MRQIFFASMACLILFFGFNSCKKDKITTDPSAKLSFSKEKVMFDTVFTKVGSATYNFKIRNTNANGLLIKSISLKHGSASQFRINVDGVASNDIKNYEIAGKDSMYVFVEVTINPNDKTLPFIVTDSIVFEVNGNTQYVGLEAYGQNATYLRYTAISGTLDPTLPYVFVDYIRVNEGTTLTIPGGTRIYMHRGTVLDVFGTLKINENPNGCDSVVITGDRLERTYGKIPGQWSAIQLRRQSHDNIIRRTIIQNGEAGVVVDSFDMADTSKPKLIIEKSTIKYMSGAAMFMVGTKVIANNLLIYYCGQYGIAADNGGNYEFTNCTIDNSSTAYVRSSPTVVVSNLPKYKANPHPALSFRMTNSIVWGSEDDEIKVYLSTTNTTATKNFFSNNIFKVKPPNNFGTANLYTDPKFKNINTRDYRLQATSPAINYGLKNSLVDDLKCNQRDSPPDVGCFEDK
ncbi:MAG: right-handed parallel beta-helix repeat-containing protein [Bacteroidetes bacterium]|nr:right-handed parallel beta-helix repeat-containing protein [Bacteroidota bacterium]